MSHRRISAGVALTVGVLSTACSGSGGGSSPTAPTPTRATSVTVVLPDTLVVGTTQTATASAVVNGATQTVTAGFRSDTTSVATVTDAGVVTPVANGLANIYVVFGGQQGTKLVRVVPGFQGAWRGSYVIRSCTQTGAFAVAPSFCDTFRVGNVLPVSMAFAQNGDRVVGQFFMGALEFPIVTTSVGGDGSVSLPATRTADALQTQVTWLVTSPQDARLTGRNSQVWRATGATGEGRIEGEIVDWLNRISAQVAPTALGPRPGSLAETFRLMRQPQ